MSHEALSGQQFPEVKPYFTKGGQGKFFKDPKPVDEHRYQRGYTPERMKEVRGWQTDISHSPDAPANAPFGGHGGARRVQEVIARSKTPASDFIHDDDQFPLHITTGSRMKGPGRSGGAAGTYEDTGFYSRGSIELNGHITGGRWSDKNNTWEHSPQMAEEDAGRTLLHELGHYKSAKVEKNPSRFYSTPAARGKEEAVADDNLMNRWRPDPRDVRAKRSTPPSPVYESESAHQGIGGKKSHKAYLAARTTPNVHAAARKEWAAKNADASYQDDLFSDYNRSRK